MLGYVIPRARPRIYSIKPIELHRDFDSTLVSELIEVILRFPVDPFPLNDQRPRIKVIDHLPIPRSQSHSFGIRARTRLVVTSAR